MRTIVTIGVIPCSLSSLAIAQERTSEPTTSIVTNADKDVVDSNPNEATTVDRPPEHDEFVKNDVPRDDEKLMAKIIAEMPDDVAAEAKSARTAFQEKEKAIATSMGGLREAQLRYRNGLDQTPAAARRFRKVRDEVWRHLEEQFDNALTLMSYLPSSEAATYALTMVQHHSTHGIYDANTYEAAARLLDTGQQYRFLFLTAARSAITVGEFETADKIYKALQPEDLEKPDRAIIGQFEIIKEQFEAEQQAIEASDPETLPQVLLSTTKGEVLIELFPKAAPSAVAHVLKLVDDGFYDGADFSQVIADILALTGDVAGDGLGNSGQFLVDEHGTEHSRHCLRGSVVMAKLPMGEGKFVEHSASCQFAIAYLPIPSVSSTQTVIGRVIQGMDNVSRFRPVDPSKEKKKGQVQIPPDSIITAEVIRRGPDLPEPNYVDMRAEIKKAVDAGLIRRKTSVSSPQ